MEPPLRLSRAPRPEPARSGGLTKLIKVAAIATPILALTFLSAWSPFPQQPAAASFELSTNSEESLVPFVQDLSLAVFHGFGLFGMWGAAAHVFRGEEELNAASLNLEILKDNDLAMIAYEKSDRRKETAWDPLLGIDEPSYIFEEEIRHSLEQIGISLENLRVGSELEEIDLKANKQFSP